MFKILIAQPRTSSRVGSPDWQFLQDVNGQDFKTDDLELLVDIFNAQCRIHPEENVQAIAELVVNTDRTIEPLCDHNGQPVDPDPDPD